MGSPQLPSRWLDNPILPPDALCLTWPLSLCLSFPRRYNHNHKSTRTLRDARSTRSAFIGPWPSRFARTISFQHLSACSISCTSTGTTCRIYAGYIDRSSSFASFPGLLPPAARCNCNLHARLCRKTRLPVDVCSRYFGRISVSLRS